MRIPAPLALGVSAALHLAGVAGLAKLPPPSRSENVAVEIVEVAPPPPPAPAPEPAPPPRAVGLAPPRRAPRVPVPTPEPAAPPPPNTPPPADAAPPSRAPVRIGVSLSATTSSGGVAAPAGNTLYGEMPKAAPDPGEVKPYRSERYVPPTEVTVLPRPVGECRPPNDEYPKDALRLGIEGVVVLVLTVDEKGAIADARVVEDPGHGLGAAAARSVRAHCRFEPARRGGEAVATSFRFKVRFELP
ncbi:MAG TPA: energy transducer TonB [Anaeromyxobacter sp.]|nr:energy transducer TonB [Anaeromyxobacter sp.]